MILKNNNPYKGASFSFKNRLLRLIWAIAYLFLFKLSPRPLHSWRAFLLRVFGAKIGKSCHIYPGVQIWAPWNLVIGNYVGIADKVILYSMDKINIGNFVTISDGAHLCCGTHDYNSKNFQLVSKPIIIKSRVWICSGAFIHPGIEIPEGAVVGARSVVTKSLFPGWTVFSGNPCKKISIRKKISGKFFN